MHHHHHRQDSPAIATQPAVVDITLLGGFRVAIDGVRSAGWGRRRAATLVKILALAPGHRLHREELMDLLWPGVSPASAAPRLHKAAHFARRAAGHDGAVVLRGDVVWLFPDADVTVDVVRFEQLARVAVARDDAGAAREALGWYGGDLLPSDRYEDWAASRRELLALRRLDVLRVAGEWRELAELDPTDEEAHTKLMHQHLGAGAGRAALRQFEHLERVLGQELGVEPGEDARRACQEALRVAQTQARTGVPRVVEEMLAELADLVGRQRAVLAQLAAAGAAPLAASLCGATW